MSNTNPKVVLVTGSATGVGRAAALRFAQNGYHVVVNYSRSEADARETLKLVTDCGVRGLLVKADVGVDAEVRGMLQTIEQEFGRLDVLVNNAACTFPGGGDEWSPDVFDAALALNLGGPVRLTAACRRALVAAAGDRPGGSCVVNLVSMAAFRANTIVPGYSAAKAGLVAATRNLAARWVERGVRVNAVAPGVIDTPMTAPMAAFPELLDAEVAHIPMGRLGTPAEVAAAVLFLASDAASYVTGETLAVDGGYLLP